MGCCRYHDMLAAGCDTAFTIQPPIITFGAGCLREAGARARACGMTRVAIFTDPVIATLGYVETVANSLRSAGIDVAIYAECAVEPTDVSFREAARFAREGDFDGYFSVGGGSVIDTCKAANLYATHPVEEFLAYVNAPIGEGREVPGPLMPHIACPTTAGTGSESTGIAIFDLLSHHVKTGIASRHIRPTQALVDPDVTLSLPRMVIACSAFDILCHALESYTARPYTHRPAPADPTLRPASQGANPWSDMGCREALRLLGEFMVRGVEDAGDRDARAELMWAATLAGIAFGNAGVHAPHGMAYAVAGVVRDFKPADYPDHEPMVPHGMSVVLSAPAVFEHTAPGDPARHLEAASLLGADTRGAGEEDAGEVLSERISQLMRACSMPNGLAEVGYGEDDIDALVEGAYAQQRLLVNAPSEMTREVLADLFRGSMTCW